MRVQAAAANGDINLRAAKSYINNGYALVPLCSPESVERWNSDHPDEHKTTKMPTLRNWQDKPVITIEGAKNHWGRHPTKGIGIVAGERYGVLWLDADEKYGGLNWLASKIDEHGPFPKQTLRNRTGGGGIQIGFAYPTGMAITNSANTTIGIDFRGGYVVDDKNKGTGQCAVFPTVHPSGLQYSWADGQAPWNLHVGELAPPPDWVVEQALGQQSASTLRTIVSDIPTAGADKLGPGKHHYEIKMLIRALYDMGLSSEAILKEACDFNARRFEPPISEGEISGWVDWVVKTHDRRAPVSLAGFPAPRHLSVPTERKPVKLWMDSTEVDPDSARVEWALDGVLPLRGVTALVGPPKEGKSEFAAQLASAMEDGSEFIGLNTRKCIVLFATEEDEATFQQKALMNGLGAGVKVLYWWRAQANDINGLQASVDELCRFVDEDLENPDGLPVYVILDTYAEWADFDDENLSAEQIALMKVIRLASAERELGFLVLFHAGNNGQLRGSSALRGSVSQIVYLRNPNPSDEDQTKRLLRTKGRYPRRLLHLDFDDPYERDGKGYYVTSEFPESFGKRLSSRDENVQRVVSLMEAAPGWVTAREVADQSGWSTDTARKYLALAVSQCGAEFDPGDGTRHNPSRWRLT